MATMEHLQFRYPMAVPVLPEALCWPLGDPPIHAPYHPGFLKTTHTCLQVVGKGPQTQQTPEPKQGTRVPLKVINGTDGKIIELFLKSADTIGKLKRKFLQKRPDLEGSLNLAYNGKPVLEHQSLGELGVKAGATFITYQRCNGG